MDEVFLDATILNGLNSTYIADLYEKWLENPKNIDVGMAERLLEKHRDIVTLSFNKQTHFTIENLIDELKELENA